VILTKKRFRYLVTTVNVTFHNLPLEEESPKTPKMAESTMPSKFFVKVRFRND